MTFAALASSPPPFEPSPALRVIEFVTITDQGGGRPGDDPHIGLRLHQQKIVLHRASMKTFAAALARRGRTEDVVVIPNGAAAPPEVDPPAGAPARSHR